MDAGVAQQQGKRLEQTTASVKLHHQQVMKCINLPQKRFWQEPLKPVQLKAAKETTSNGSQTPQQSSYQVHSPTSSTNYHTYIHVKSGKNPQYRNLPTAKQVFPTRCHFHKAVCMFWLWQLYTFPPLLAKVRVFHTLLSTFKCDLSNHHSRTANRISVCTLFPPNKTISRWVSQNGTKITYQPFREVSDVHR